MIQRCPFLGVVWFGIRTGAGLIFGGLLPEIPKLISTSFVAKTHDLTRPDGYFTGCV